MRAKVNEILEMFSNYITSHHYEKTPMLAALSAVSGLWRLGVLSLAL